jgi:hypothetical protein
LSCTLACGSHGGGMSAAGSQQLTQVLRGDASAATSQARRIDVSSQAVVEVACLAIDLPRRPRAPRHISGQGRWRQRQRCEDQGAVASARWAPETRCQPALDP